MRTRTQIKKPHPATGSGSPNENPNYLINVASSKCITDQSIFNKSLHSHHENSKKTTNKRLVKKKQKLHAIKSKINAIVQYTYGGNTALALVGKSGGFLMPVSSGRDLTRVFDSIKNRISGKISKRFRKDVEQCAASFATVQKLTYGAIHMMALTAMGALAPVYQRNTVSRACDPEIIPTLSIVHTESFAALADGRKISIVYHTFSNQTVLVCLGGLPAAFIAHGSHAGQSNKQPKTCEFWDLSFISGNRYGRYLDSDFCDSLDEAKTLINNVLLGGLVA